MKALVTGASSGIGREIAIELSKKGYDLILVARNEEGLKEVSKKIKTKSEIIAMDLTDIENCKKLHNQVGRVDILINNAGFGDFGAFEKTELNKDINMIKTNVIALHVLTKVFLEDMIKENSGKILNVASIAGFMPGPLMATYYSTKAYVVRLTDSIRAELKEKKSNVQISLLCPGPVNTNFNNVANVKFNMKSHSSQFVAKYAIEKLLKGKYMIIPGIKIKLGIYLSKITPKIILSKIAYRVQQRKYKE